MHHEFWGARAVWMAASAMAVVAQAGAACAQPAAGLSFSLPAQSLEQSLRDVSVRTGTSVVAPSALVADRPAPALTGRYTALSAVEALIAGSGLAVQRVDNALVIVPREPAGAATGGDEAQANDQDIVVTGTNLRGAQPTSPLITITREEIDRVGATSVDQLMRILPQNMQGGVNKENSGVVLPDQDVTDHGAGLNLRGLGQRATLVLVNGRRLAPSGGGAFVDVSLIPVTALERVEILTDGASAIYGSDAVGGVVNFILRDRFDGLEAGVQVGTATRGGGDQLQASLAAGRDWGSGNAAGCGAGRRPDHAAQPRCSADAARQAGLARAGRGPQGPGAAAVAGMTMPDLRLPKLPDRTPVKISISVSPDLNHALGDYAALYQEAYGASEPIHELIPAILESFLAADRAFARRRKEAAARR